MRMHLPTRYIHLHYSYIVQLMTRAFSISFRLNSILIKYKAQYFKTSTCIYIIISMHLKEIQKLVSDFFLNLFPHVISVSTASGCDFPVLCTLETYFGLNVCYITCLKILS